MNCQGFEYIANLIKVRMIGWILSPRTYFEASRRHKSVGDDESCAHIRKTKRKMQRNRFPGDNAE